MPEPGPREVLVEIASVGVCGSDVHYYEHGRIGRYVVRRAAGARPRVRRGASSRVGAERDQARRRATAWRSSRACPCGRCRECRAGRYNLCPDVVFFATPPVDGAFAELRRRSTRTSRSRCPTRCRTTSAR